MDVLKKILPSIYRVISVVFIIFFFVPMFVVSCGDKTANVNAAHAMIGYSEKTFYGSQRVDPQLALILLLLLPVAGLAISIWQRKLPKLIALVSALEAAGIVYGYICFKNYVMAQSEKLDCIMHYYGPSVGVGDKTVYIGFLYAAVLVLGAVKTILGIIGFGILDLKAKTKEEIAVEKAIAKEEKAIAKERKELEAKERELQAKEAEKFSKENDTEV